MPESLASHVTVVLPGGQRQTLSMDEFHNYFYTLSDAEKTQFQQQYASTGTVQMNESQWQGLERARSDHGSSFTPGELDAYMRATGQSPTPSAGSNSPLTPQQEQQRQQYNAQHPGNELSPNTFAARLQMTGTPASNQSTNPFDQQAAANQRLVQQANGVNAQGQSRSGQSGNSGVNVPLTGGLVPQNQMMAGNTAAQTNYPVGSIPANDRIEQSVYSTMGAGIPNLSPGELDRMHRNADNRSPDQIAMANRVNDPYNVAITQSYLQAAAGGGVGRKGPAPGPEGETTQGGDPLDAMALRAQDAEQRYRDGKITRAQYESFMRTLQGEVTAEQQRIEASTKANTTQSAYDAAVAASDAASGTTSGSSTSTAGQFPLGSPFAIAPTEEEKRQIQREQLNNQSRGLTPPLDPITGRPVDATSTPGGSAPGTTPGTTPGTNTPTVTPTQQGNAPLLLNDLTGSYQDAFNESRDANIARYEDIIRGRLGLIDSSMDMVNRLGETSRNDIDRGAIQQGSRAEQDLINRGLGNTTIRNSAMRGVESDRVRAQSENEERLLGQRLGLQTQLNSDLFNFMERREDPMPDIGLLAQLSQGLGTAGPNAQVPATGTPAAPAPTTPAPATGTTPPATTPAPATPAAPATGTTPAPTTPATTSMPSYTPIFPATPATPAAAPAAPLEGMSRPSAADITAKQNSARLNGTTTNSTMTPAQIQARTPGTQPTAPSTTPQATATPTASQRMAAPISMANPPPTTQPMTNLQQMTAASGSVEAFRNQLGSTAPRPNTTPTAPVTPNARLNPMTSTPLNRPPAFNSSITGKTKEQVAAENAPQTYVQPARPAATQPQPTAQTAPTNRTPKPSSLGQLPKEQYAQLYAQTQPSRDSRQGPQIAANPQTGEQAPAGHSWERQYDGSYTLTQNHSSEYLDYLQRMDRMVV